MDTLIIGKLAAAAAGVGVDTVRFYERAVPAQGAGRVMRVRKPGGHSNH